MKNGRMPQIGDTVVVRRELRKPSAPDCRVPRGSTGYITQVINRGDLIAVELDDTGHEIVVNCDEVDNYGPPHFSCAWDYGYYALYMRQAQSGVSELIINWLDE